MQLFDLYKSTDTRACAEEKNQGRRGADKLIYIRLGQRIFRRAHVRGSVRIFL